MRIGSGKHRGKKAVSGEETKRMKRNVDIKEISDGRLYEAGDLVKADTGGCAGCCDCCRGMGTSIILDPYDVWRLQTEAGLRMETMLQKEAELNVVDGLILPNLKMQGEEERCAFLDPHGRCGVHRARPGVCRAGPLRMQSDTWRGGTGRALAGRDVRILARRARAARRPPPSRRSGSPSPAAVYAVSAATCAPSRRR